NLLFSMASPYWQPDSRFSNNIPINFIKPVHHTLFGKLAEKLLPLPYQTLRKFPVGKALNDPVRQHVRIFQWNDKTGSVVQHYLGIAAGIGKNRWHPGHGSLRLSQWNRLDFGKHDNDLGTSVIPVQLIARHSVVKFHRPLPGQESAKYLLIPVVIAYYP